MVEIYKSNMTPEPKIGVDYVGITTSFYCHDGKGNFLLHKRSKNTRDEQGSWDVGGGKLEFGLTLRENVLKEIEEEYGCTGVIKDQLPPYEIFRMNDGKKTHWIAFPFVVRVARSKVKNCEPHKIDELGWFKLSALPTPLHKGSALGFKQNKKYFAKL